MLKRIKKYLLRIALITFLDLILAGVICLIFKLKTIESYSNVLLYLGAGILALGILSTAGNNATSGRADYQIAKTLLDGDPEARTKYDIDSAEQSLNFSILTVCVGGISILLSIIVGQFI